MIINMKGHSLYLQLGQVLHPRVRKVINRNLSPLTPEIRIKDFSQPSQGYLIKKNQTSSNADH